MRASTVRLLARVTWLTVHHVRRASTVTLVRVRVRLVLRASTVRLLARLARITVRRVVRASTVRLLARLT